MKQQEKESVYYESFFFIYTFFSPTIYETFIATLTTLSMNLKL